MSGFNERAYFSRAGSRAPLTSSQYVREREYKEREVMRAQKDARLARDWRQMRLLTWVGIACLAITTALAAFALRYDLLP